MIRSIKWKMMKRVKVNYFNLSPISKNRISVKPEYTKNLILLCNFYIIHRNSLINNRNLNRSSDFASSL